MSKQPNRHEILVANGWRYDPNQDRYAAPGSTTDGTEKWHNLESAWASYQASQDAAKATPPTGQRLREKDPREQEPQ